MTLRLSNLFEAQLKAIMSKKTPKRKPTRLTRRPRRPATGTSSNPVPGPSRDARPLTADDSDEDDMLSPRMVRIIRRGATSQTNGVSSSHTYHSAAEAVGGPNVATGRPTRRPQQNVQQPVASTSAASGSVPRRSRREEREVNEDSDSDSFGSSSSSSDSDGSAGDLPLASLGGNKNSQSRRRPNAASDPSYSDDSEESYNPTVRGSRQAAKRAVTESARKRRPEKNGSKPVSRKTNGRAVERSKRNTRPNGVSRIDDDNDDDDDEDEDVEVEATEDEPDAIDEDDDANDEDYNVSRTPKKSRSAKRPNRAKKNNVLDTSSDENAKRRSTRKPQRYESDHSYHIDPSRSNGTSGTHRRRIQLDSDPEPEEAARPKRPNRQPTTQQVIVTS